MCPLWLVTSHLWQWIGLDLQAYMYMYVCTCTTYICIIIHRYAYPFFGSPYPVVVQPPVPLLPGTEQNFAASCCAFTFATDKSQLERQLHVQPLSVEVWATRKAGSDNLVGIAKVHVHVCEHAHSSYVCIRSMSVISHELKWDQYSGTSEQWTWWGPAFCPLFGGCPFFRGSAIKCSNNNYFMQTTWVILIKGRLIMWVMKWCVDQG